jgi:hypothetical protein
LLDEDRPNLVARVLVDLVGRPPTSPAVVRARGGGNAVDPVASLLEPLHPDGGWRLPPECWRSADGPVSRMVAAAQLGADPDDPRLRSAIAAWLDRDDAVMSTDGDRASTTTTPWSVARSAQTWCSLGWVRHLTVQEALAWLEEAAPSSKDGGWADDRGGECAATAAAVLSALAPADGTPRRRRLFDRAMQSVDRLLARGDADQRWTVPRFDRSDVLELLWAAARAGTPWNPAWSWAIRAVQDAQDHLARWSACVATPLDAAMGEGAEGTGRPSGWLTLEGVGVLLRYAPDAGLARRFPERPGA